MPKQPAHSRVFVTREKEGDAAGAVPWPSGAVVLWTRLLAFLIARNYPEGWGRRVGARSMPIETMAAGLLSSRTGMALSDPMAEETLYDSEAMRPVLPGSNWATTASRTRPRSSTSVTLLGATWSYRGDLRRDERAPGPTRGSPCARALW